MLTAISSQPHLADLEQSLQHTGLRPVIPSISVSFLARFSSLSDLQTFVLAEDHRIEAFLAMAYQVSDTWMVRCCGLCRQMPIDSTVSIDAMPPYPFCTAIAGFLQGGCVNCHAVRSTSCVCQPKPLSPAVIQRMLHSNLTVYILLTSSV
jgi:hypothetical protein